jgi:ribosomal protein S18 acetylase RimI-like enzyme
LVAEADGAIVGQVFVQLMSRKGVYADGTSSGYLYAFRVRPEYRNQGIGGELMQAAENALRERAFNRAVIAVAKTNERARNLYEKMGYRKIGDDPGRWSYLDHEGNLRHITEPAYILEKEL